MIELENDIIIDRPPHEVWRFVGNPAMWHTWREAMKEPAVKVGNGPIEVGSKFAYRSAFMGRSVDTEFEVVGYEPDHAITATTDVPVNVRLAFRCEPAGDGTRVVQETYGEVGGFFGIAEPLVKPLMKRQFQKNLEDLKEAAEQ
jgi:uncharacterized protein YndB with AHSA1/START domain